MNKKSVLSSQFSVVLISAFCFQLSAFAAGAPALDAANPFSIGLDNLWMVLRGDFGWQTALFAWMGVLRVGGKLVGKHIQEFAERALARVVETSDEGDDHIAANVLANPFYRAGAFLVDMATSLKLPLLLPVNSKGEIFSAGRRILPILFLSFLLSAFCFSTGCVTATHPDGTTEQRLDPVKTAAAIRIATETAVPIVLRKDPDSRKFFLLAESALSITLNDTNLDAQVLRETIAQIDGSDDAWMAVSLAIGLYQLYAADVVSQQLDRNVYLRPSLTAFRDAIAAALRTVPPPQVGLVAPRAPELEAPYETGWEQMHRWFQEALNFEPQINDHGRPSNFYTHHTRERRTWRRTAFESWARNNPRLLNDAALEISSPADQSGIPHCRPSLSICG